MIRTLILSLPFILLALPSSGQDYGGGAAHVGGAWGSPPVAGGGGVEANSILFPLSTDYAIYDCGTDCVAINSDTDFTIEFWRLAHTTQSGASEFIPAVGTWDSGSGDNAIAALPSGNTANEWWLYADSGRGEASYSGHDTTVDDTTNWHHFAYVFEDADTDCILYIDGSEVQEDTGCPLDSTGVSADSTVVGDVWTDSFNPRAYITEVRIWDAVRTPTEIADHYDCQLACADTGGCPTNLQNYWPMNDDTSGSSTLADEKAGGTGAGDLTLNGNAAWDTEAPAFGGNDGVGDCYDAP